jgi:hypothetical protein
MLVRRKLDSRTYYIFWGAPIIDPDYKGAVQTASYIRGIRIATSSPLRRDIVSIRGNLTF